MRCVSVCVCVFVSVFVSACVCVSFLGSCYCGDKNRLIQFSLR